MDSSPIGPSLPPTGASCTEPNQTSSNVIGPVLPPGFAAAAPSSGSEDSDSDSSRTSASDSDDVHARKTISGPQLPKNFKKMKTDSGIPHSSAPTTMGPSLPPGYTQKSSDEDSDSGFGPRPPKPGTEKSAIEEFEDRARLMKHRLLHGDEEDTAPKRETWMMELPSGGLAKHMGLVARKLGSGSSVKDQDRSMWTDTPADRARKLQEEAEGRGVKRPHEEVPVQSERDRMMAEQVHKHNKSKREKSLLEMHQKKISKQKKKEQKKRRKEKKKKDKKNKKDKKTTSSMPERRPFSREDDLQVNRFDAAQRKSLIRQSQQLNCKFGAGKQQFL